MADSRKQGIRDMAVPITLKQLRSFLGMINFFRDFTPKLSEDLVNPTELTKTKTHKTFQWNEAADKAFIEAKNLIWSTTSLYQLEDEGKIILYTDASTIGIGGTLMQVQRGGKEYPILYVSHKFSAAAQKWSSIEQECFAVFYCVIRLQQYLLGRHFYIATDHRN